MYTWKLTSEEIDTVASLVAKGKKEQEKNHEFAIMDMDNFLSLFNEKEIALIQKFLSIKPDDLGYKLPYIGYPDKAPQLVAFLDQPYIFNGQPVPCQYLPVEAGEAYRKLNIAMKDEISKEVGVLYGYRSPARQAFIFFDILERKYDYDFDKTIKRVCFPDYSEHVCFQKQAIDFLTEEGVCEGLEKTEEYKWLKENAKRFGFIESYPKDNELGMMWEPWHWRYDG